MTLIVGLTGGIGSGKTVASDHFASLGVPVIDTDVLARQVVQPGQPALLQLAEAFGEGILLENGHLNRDALRQLAFSDKQSKAKLDSITHPAIGVETASQLGAVSAPYCIIVVPLLKPGSAFIEMMNRVLVVTAERETKIKRVMQRSQISREQVEAIMQTQLSDEQRMTFADDVIENNHDIQYVHSRVDELHAMYLEAALIRPNE